MDFLSGMVDYQPILVGAGCLALGYAYGRHCRSWSEMQASGPMVSEDFCAQSQSNTGGEEYEKCKCCMSAPAALDTMALKLHSEADCSPEIHPLGRKKIRKMFEEDEETLQAQLTPCKKQKNSGILKIFPQLNKKNSSNNNINNNAELAGASTSDSERVREDPRVHSDEPWGQDVLQQRAEYFNKVTSAAAASIDKAAAEEATARCKMEDALGCWDREEANGTRCTPSQKSASNNTARSSSGLGALAIPDWEQPATAECALDDTGTSPRRELGNGHSEMESEPVDMKIADPMIIQMSTDDPMISKSHCNCKLAYIECHPGANPLEDDIDFYEICNRDSVTWCELRVPDHHHLHLPTPDDLDVNVGEVEADLEVDLEGDVLLTPVADHDQCVHLEAHEVIIRAGLLEPTSVVASPKPRDQDRSWDEDETRRPAFPVDRVLKAEIYELLSEADCSKVSFEEIVSLLEEKLHCELREDKAHIVALVREVISFSKLLEEETALEGSHKAEPDLIDYNLKLQ